MGRCFLDSNKEKIKCLIVQIPSNNKINKLSLDLQVNQLNYHTVINIKRSVDNFFYLFNINNERSISENRFFTYFLDYFFYNKNVKEKNMQENLIKACISRISYKEIVLSIENILRFFKLCIQFKKDPKNIDYI